MEQPEQQMTARQQTHRAVLTRLAALEERVADQDAEIERLEGEVAKRVVTLDALTEEGSQ